MALRGQEGVGHAASDDERVDLGRQDLEDGQLVGHLGAADDGDEGPGRSVEEVLKAPRPRGRSAARPRLGRKCGGPTMEASLRCAAPNASFT